MHNSIQNSYSTCALIQKLYHITLRGCMFLAMKSMKCRLENGLMDKMDSLNLKHKHNFLSSRRWHKIMINEDCSITVWEPTRIYAPDYQFAIVVLNQPILLQHDYVLPLWEKAQVTVTVDGGTNKWMDYLGIETSNIVTGKSEKYLPMLIVGDMDSISPDLLDKLKLSLTKIIYTPDVMETDYTKSLIQLGEYIRKNNIELSAIHVLVESSGRLDQIVSTVNTLYKSHKYLNDLPVIQIASESFTWLLKPGVHKIIIPDDIVKSKSWCALIPFGSSNNCVTTTGLKWNLNKTCLKFGELISTSNTYDGHPEVTVDTNVPLIWAMGIKALTRVES